MSGLLIDQTDVAQRTSERDLYRREAAEARRLERVCRRYLHRDMPDAYILLVLAAHGFCREDIKRLYPHYRRG